MDEAPIKRSQGYWDGFFMGLARQAALCSKDPDRKVGAVLVSPDRRQLSIGYNGFPASVPDRPEWLEDKERKLKHMVHAEPNCLLQAPFSPIGCTLYVTRFPCYDCAAEHILFYGVKHVVAPRPDFGHLRWGESWIHAQARLQAAGVKITYMEVE